MINVMAHMIPFYPNREASASVAAELIAGGVRYLELQFPFSDPNADGPVIEAACQTALAEGFTVDKGFEFIEELRARHPEIADDRCEICIMTYGSIVFARGVERFVREASERGVKGLIVPDLPLDSDEGLIEAGRKYGVDIVPVLAANARPQRIALAGSVHPKFIYCALRSGITGKKTELGADNMSFLEAVRDGVPTETVLLAGFGIRGRDQVEALDGKAQTAVVGSAFLSALNSGNSVEEGLAKVGELAKALVG